jgi:glycosyltransferase involved in cell wall biosynthesis
MTAVSAMPVIASHALEAASTHRRKVLHFITGVGGGGAENFLRLLVNQMRDSAWETVIVVVRVHPHEALADQLRAVGATIYDLNENALIKPRVWLAVRRLIAAEKPDVVQTWMHHADFIGSIAALAAGVKNVVWGVRATEVFRNPGDSNLKMRLFHLALRAASKLLPRKIISNSTLAINTHRGMGYPQHKFVFVPNGVNAERFAPNAAVAKSTRAELGIPDGAPIIGFVGRFHEIKDLVTLFNAARIVQNECDDVHFVLVGGTEMELYPEARKAYEALPHCELVHFVPFGSSTEKFYPAFTVFTLTSRSEAFPNVVLEAMATGIPCVTTDAGDCAAMLHDLGKVVPVGDANALAHAWLSTLHLPESKRAALTRCSRERALQDFGMERAARSFISVYEGLLA